MAVHFSFYDVCDPLNFVGAQQGEAVVFDPFLQGVFEVDAQNRPIPLHAFLYMTSHYNVFSAIHFKCLAIFPNGPQKPAVPQLRWLYIKIIRIRTINR
jgi:hypothetical protein